MTRKQDGLETDKAERTARKDSIVGNDRGRSAQRRTTPSGKTVKEMSKADAAAERVRRKAAREASMPVEDAEDDDSDIEENETGTTPETISPSDGGGVDATVSGNDGADVNTSGATYESLPAEDMKELGFDVNETGSTPNSIPPEGQAEETK
jgi:hypothetical protein